jgi:hypothetical protein
VCYMYPDLAGRSRAGSPLGLPGTGAAGGSVIFGFGFGSGSREYGKMCVEMRELYSTTHVLLALLTTYQAKVDLH